MSAGLICCEVEHLHQELNGSQSFSWSGQWHQTPSFNLGLSHCTDGIHDDGLFEDRFIAKRKYGCEVRAKINFTQVLSSCTLLVGVSPVCHLHHRPPPPWLLLVPFHFIVIQKVGFLLGMIHIQVPDILTSALPCPPYLVGLKTPLEGWWLNWLEVNRLQRLNTHGEMKYCTFFFGVQSTLAWVGWSRLSFLLPTSRYVMVTGPGYMASGSIISKNYILTCSHCLPR